MSCSFLAGLFRCNVKHLHLHTYETVSIVKYKTVRVRVLRVVCQTVQALCRWRGREERGRQKQGKTARWAPVPTCWTKAWYEQRSNQCHFLFRHAWATAGHQQPQNDSSLSVEWMFAWAHQKQQFLKRMSVKVLIHLEVEQVEFGQLDLFWWFWRRFTSQPRGFFSSLPDLNL